MSQPTPQRRSSPESVFTSKPRRDNALTKNGTEKLSTLRLVTGEELAAQGAEKVEDLKSSLPTAFKQSVRDQLFNEDACDEYQRVRKIAPWILVVDMPMVIKVANYHAYQLQEEARYRKALEAEDEQMASKHRTNSLQWATAWFSLLDTLQATPMRRKKLERDLQAARGKGRSAAVDPLA